MESTSEPSRPARGAAFVTGGAYGLLFLFGAMQALVGSFQYSRSVGPVPVAALACCALILATCLAGGAAMGSAAGALAPAIGWFAASFVLTLPTAQGSVIVTGNAAGEWYLYGGSITAAVAVLVAFVRRVRAAVAAPPGPPARAGRRGPSAPDAGP